MNAGTIRPLAPNTAEAEYPDLDLTSVWTFGGSNATC